MDTTEAAEPSSPEAREKKYLTVRQATLLHEPASIVTPAGILALSVALDYGRKHFRDTRAKNVQLAH